MRIRLDIRLGFLWSRVGVTSSTPCGKECTEWDNVRMLDEQYVESEFQALQIRADLCVAMCYVSQPSILATNRGQLVFV